MPGYNFTERARLVLAMAREQAIARRREYVGPEHILVGIAIEGNGVACAVLQNLDVDLADIVRRIDAAIVQAPAESIVIGPDLPYTSRAKKSLELAIASARDFDNTYVGTEHLLLGLVREEKGLAAQLLTMMGAPFERVRAETLRLLDSEVRPVERSSGHPAARPVERSSVHAAARPVERSSVHTDVASVAVEIRKTDGTVVKQEFQSVFTAIGFLQKQI